MGPIGLSDAQVRIEDELINISTSLQEIYLKIIYCIVGMDNNAPLCKL
jgi:hypothetical protein